MNIIGGEDPAGFSTTLELTGFPTTLELPRQIQIPRTAQPYTHTQPSSAPVYTCPGV